MCAINGFNWSDKSTLFRMNTVTEHRGPDGSDVFLNNTVSLGHNRLKIIDLTDGGKQPMQSNSGRFTICFNGEIYNYRELREELKDDYTFHTQSDTEVLLASYEKWGSKCLDKLNGIFAFAIWDMEDDSIFIARDFAGVKPLYYFWDKERFIFSSEIKGILTHDIPRIVNTEAFELYMRVQYVPEPLTMFKDIAKVPPGHFLKLKNKKLTIKKYEQSCESLSKKSKQELTNDVEKTLREAVKRQLVSDRPLGIFLSGGIDSSVILDCVSKERENIDTFSIGFELENKTDEERFNKDFMLARKTASLYNTNHHEMRIHPEDIPKTIHNVIKHLDEPISNPTTISQYLLSEFAKEKVAVVLGGDGGDELFGGYERYRLARASRKYQTFVPGFIRFILNSVPKLKKLNTKPGIDHFELFMFQDDSVLDRVLKKKYISNRPKEFFNKKFFTNNSDHAEKQLMDADSKSWLVDESFMRTDKMGMAHGLEIRVPFVDKEVLAFSQTIPTKYKVTIKNTKVILKNAFKESIPDYLYNQPKRGWFSPAAKWLRHDDIHIFAKKVLKRDYHPGTSKLFDFEGIEQVFNNHVDGKGYNLTIIWSILTFQIWAKEYKVEIE